MRIQIYFFNAYEAFHGTEATMSAGILKSINSEDKLYKILMETSANSTTYPALLSNFKIYIKQYIRRTNNYARKAKLL